MSLPAIVLAELSAGAFLADTAARAAERRATISALVTHVPVAVFDADTAARWAELFAHLRRSGALKPANDLTVAATAVQLGFGVLVGRATRSTSAAFRT